MMNLVRLANSSRIFAMGTLSRQNEVIEGEWLGIECQMDVVIGITRSRVQP
jgi:hypothetical protein